jgi:hypothetical protein
MRRIAGVALSLVLASSASAQAVHGRITERTTGAVASGVVVLLLDASDNPVSRTLSNQRGEFWLASPSAGAFRIRTLRIGFRPSTSDPIDLVAGRDVERDLSVAMIPFLLDTVRATSRNACRERSGTDVASAVWEQARTALYATQISSHLPSFEATLQTYQRTYNAGSPRIREQTTGTKSGSTTAPWTTLSADSLSKVGYIFDDSRGWSTYYGPDVNVLLSREFQADHCFRLARSKDSALTGLTFDPIKDRYGISDIKGTIWMNTKSSDLVRLEYRYTGVTPVQADEGAGGQIDFVRMRNGGFAISRWSIRMPVVQLVQFSGRGGLGAPSGQQPRLMEVRVVGGDLVAATVAGDTLWTRPNVSLTGIVADSSSGARLAFARVALAGTELHTVTDAHGRFEIPDVLPGDYTLEVRTASLDSMNALHQANVTVIEGVGPVTVRVARGDQLARALCAFDRGYAKSNHVGIILGTSRLLGDSAPPSNVSVAAEWVEMEFKVEFGQASGKGIRKWKETRTDGQGNFRLCGVPVNSQILLRASGDSADASPVEVKIMQGQRFARTELTFDRIAARSAVFSGTVFQDSTQTPLPEVEVVLPGLMRSMLTNDEGRFRFSDLPAGEHKVIARRVGFGAMETELTFAPGRTQVRRIYLTKLKVLEQVEVTASRQLRDFEEHRKTGLGQYLTRSDLAAKEHLTMAAIMRDMRGLRIQPVQNMLVVETAHVVQDQDRIRYRGDIGIEQILHCYPDVYIDKLVVYSRDQGGPLFDINSLKPDQIEAIEVFTTRLQLPMEYSRRASLCGAVIIHTRQTFDSTAAKKKP